MDAVTDIKKQQQAKRAIYEYTLPEELQALDDTYVKKSIGLVKLEMSEEIAAGENAKGNQARLAYRMARFALWEVDGRRVSKGDGEDESILEHTDPQIREMILIAYTDMNTAEEAVAKKFLASRKIKAV